MSEHLSAPFAPANSVRTGPTGNGPAAEAPADPGAPPAPAWQRRVWLALRTAPRGGLIVGVLCAAVLGLGGAVAELGKPTTYTSKTVMLIDDPYLLATSGDNGQLLKLDSLRIKYSSLINTSAIANPVANKLGLRFASVVGSVSGVVPLTSLLLDVQATWSDPHEAQVLSQATANELTAYVETEDTTYGIPPSHRFSIKTIDPAGTPAAAGPSAAAAAAAFFGLGLLGLVLGFAATQLVRNRRLLR